MRECEELLKIMQRNRDSRLDLAGGSRLASRQNVALMPSMPEAEELRQLDRKSTRLNSSHAIPSRMPSSA